MVVVVIKGIGYNCYYNERGTKDGRRLAALEWVGWGRRRWKGREGVSRGKSL
jgi:hypothetical protein